MSPVQILRRAWAIGILAAAFGFGYLVFAPIQRSYALDNLLGILTAIVGGITGAMIEGRIERLIRRVRERTRSLIEA